MNKIYGIRRYRKLEEELADEGGYGDVMYVGKTNRELYQRLEEHRNDKSHDVKTEWLMKNDHEIILLEDDLEDWEVATREQYWIDRLGTFIKLNRMRAKKHTYNDGVNAMKRAKQMIKDMKKANK
jgi:hypothetical protein